MSLNKHIGIIPVFVSHMGCPNECTFCNQRKISGVSDAILPNQLIRHLETYLSTMKRDQVELAFFGGSFTGIESNQQIEYLKIAKDLKEKNVIQRIRISTRPDYIDDAIIERLKAYTVDIVELGCQSFHQNVLDQTKRGHRISDIYQAVALLKKADIHVGIQLMVGLPGDDEVKFEASVDQTIAFDPYCIRVYPTLVIKDTELEQMYKDGAYRPISLDEAIKFTAMAVRKFESKGLNVIRVGLQRTDLIDIGASVIAGPFHPAFGEMVWSKIFADEILEQLKHMSLDGECTICVHPKRRSIVIGQNKSNLLQFSSIRSDANIDSKSMEIKIVEDETVKLNEVRIETKQEVNTFSIL